MTSNAEQIAQLTARRAERRDLSAMLALISDDVLGKNRDTTASDNDPVYANAFEVISNDPNQMLLVGELAGNIIAMLQITFIPGLSRRGAWRANIEVVRVNSAMRNRGIGGWLMRQAIDLARVRGCALVQLTSDVQRQQAHAFYDRLGFVHSHAGFKLKL
jgi:ribosomal protein S18 acetylase RimI-like enzyme